MTDFIDIVRGSDPVSEVEALKVFEVLGPLIDTDPDSAEAVEVAAKLIARMPSDSMPAAVLDWWFVVTTGWPPPLGLAFRLPEVLPPSLRHAMEDVVQLTHRALQVPPARWVHARRDLDRLLAELDQHLILDSYGKSKLPGEREAWGYLQAQLHAVVSALHEGRRAERFELDERSYEKEMKRSGIDENSRRWNEMTKRATECVNRVNEVVDVQSAVEPWIARDIPPLIDTAPAEIWARLGELTDILFSSIIDPGPSSGPLRREMSEQAAATLREVTASLDDVSLTWLASVTEPWMRKTGHVVEPLMAAVRRRDALSERIERLRNASVDADEAELLLLDHDTVTAEQVVDRLEERRKQSRREEALRGALTRFRGPDSAAAIPDGWSDRVDEVEALLNAGDVVPAERLAQGLDSELRAFRRNDAMSELRTLRAELAHLQAPSSVLTELAGYLDELDGRPDKQIDPSVVHRSRERSDSLAGERHRELERRIQTAYDLLEIDRDLIHPDSLPGLELRLAEVERVLAEDDVMTALAFAASLVDDIEGQRVHRWSTDEGEAALVDHVVGYCTQQLHFDPDDIRRLYVAVKTKPFVILAGLTGSGKSTIARLFAAALGADAGNGRFRRIAVRPDWIDQSEVLGSVNPLSNRFEPGWLAEVARQCERNLDQIHVVLLDEMNLAPVEQYLAEYLSAIEEARSGSDSTVIPLYSQGASPVNAHEWPASLPFPPNLMVIGTVNIDETTRVMSERVLDRANVLQLSVAVSDAHHRPRSRSVRPWYVPFLEWDSVCERDPDDGHHEFLVDVGEILQSIGIGLGQRSHAELERFMANSRGVLDAQLSLDVGVLQRIIPKVRGFKRDLASGLAELEEALESAGCSRSAAVVARWLADDVPDDEYLDGTDARIALVR